jgi:hypothetical protein
MGTCSKGCFVVLVLAAVGGCGDGHPKRVPVAGQVLIDGTPLTHGEIEFVSKMGRPSIGRLDKDGRFRLTCYTENDGALLGEHQLAITAGEGINESKTRWFAPKKYSDPRTSGLAQQIDGPKENLVINITWDGGHEFVEVLNTDVDNKGADEGFGGARKARRKKAE